MIDILIGAQRYSLNELRLTIESADGRSWCSRDKPS